MSEKYRRLLDDRDAGQESAPDATGRSFLERQLEWLTLGLTIILFGLALLMQTQVALRVLFPVIAGAILLVSAIVQKIGRNWNVSIFTWALGVFLLAFGITNVLGALQPESSFNFTTFFGSLVVLGGVVVLLQIFRRG